MIVHNVKSASKFLGVSIKTARELIPRLPHGDVSRSTGPNHSYVIAQETLEAFVRGEIQAEPVGSEANVVDIRAPRKKQPRYIPATTSGFIPRRKPGKLPALQAEEAR